jgi:aryl-alcohol dehydrogenase-like predicted oxidoreductase
MQNHYNLLYREEEREMVPLCKDQGVGLIPWSPLARGKLARPPEATATKRSETDRYSTFLYGNVAAADARVLAALDTLAQKRKVPHAQVALAWLLGRGGVTAPIVGATKMHHLDDAVAALSVALSKDEVAVLEAPYVPHPMAGYR